MNWRFVWRMSRDNHGIWCSWLQLESWFLWLETGTKKNNRKKIWPKPSFSQVSVMFERCHSNVIPYWGCLSPAHHSLGDIRMKVTHIPGTASKSGGLTMALKCGNCTVLQKKRSKGVLFMLLCFWIILSESLKTQLWLKSRQNRGVEELNKCQ